MYTTLRIFIGYLFVYFVVYMVGTYSRHFAMRPFHFFLFFHFSMQFSFAFAFALQLNLRINVFRILLKTQIIVCVCVRACVCMCDKPLVFSVIFNFRIKSLSLSV